MTPSDTVGGTASGTNGSSARYCLPNCRKLRVVQLAIDSELSRDTILKIEKQRPVTEPTANAVFNALNRWHKNVLDREKEIVPVGG
jgi:hypothetical protein